MKDPEHLLVQDPQLQLPDLKLLQIQLGQILVHQLRHVQQLLPAGCLHQLQLQSQVDQSREDEYSQTTIMSAQHPGEVPRIHDLDFQ